jgi:hypothetical protein
MYHTAMKRLAEGVSRTVAVALLLVLTTACARSTASIMPMRDIPSEQQDRDRAECERAAGHLDVTKPLTGSLKGQLVYTAAGAGLGLLVSPAFVHSTSDPREVALFVGAPVAVGAVLGFATGTVIGWKSGVDRAHDEYLSVYTACMRERGYTVVRDRR